MGEICQQLRVLAEDVSDVGETATDMKTDVAEGGNRVEVLWGFRSEKELKDNGAQAIIKKPLDALDLLD